MHGLRAVRILFLGWLIFWACVTVVLASDYSAMLPQRRHDLPTMLWMTWGLTAVNGYFLFKGWQKDGRKNRLDSLIAAATRELQSGNGAAADRLLDEFAERFREHYGALPEEYRGRA